MAEKNNFSVGAAAKFCGTFCDAGGTPKELNNLAEDPKGLEQLLLVRRGLAEIRPVHLMNCDADPFVPYGYRVRQHRSGGIFRWSPSQVELYLSESQINGDGLVGEVLYCNELRNKPVMNACALDHFLADQYLIPEEWKDFRVSFWGTQYLDVKGRICVRRLTFFDGRWMDCYLPINDMWCGKNDRAALHKLA